MDIVFPGLLGSETTADNIIIDKISAELKVTFGLWALFVKSSFDGCT